MNKYLSLFISFFVIAIISFYLGRFSIQQSTCEKLIPLNQNNNLASKVIERKDFIKPVMKIDNSISKKSYSIQRKYYSKTLEQRNKDQRIVKLIQEAFDKSLAPDGIENFQEVVDLYEEILELSPENEKAYEFYSNYLMLKQEYDSALPLLKSCIDKFPKNGLCHHNMTNYFLFKQEDVHLNESIDNCLGHLPNHVGCLFNLAQFFLRKGRFKESIEIFMKIRNGEYDSSITFSSGAISNGIALNYEGLRNKNKAIEYHKMACNDGNDYSCKKVSGEIPLMIN